MACYQLTYRSRVSIDPVSLAGERQRILADARIFNRRFDITGCLAHSHEWFVQVIEGNRADIDALFCRIEKDRRHTAIEILARRDIRTRSFPDWSMADIDLAGASNHPMAMALTRPGFYSPATSLISAQLMMLLSLADQTRLQSIR
jgi:Sensors of blue-light using FAD